MGHNKDTRQLIMNLEDINSVQDLLNANHEEPNLPAELCKPIYEQEPKVALECAIDILENLIALHDDVMTKMGEHKKAHEAGLWGVDLGRIDVALTALKDVNL